ncbi:hypothetical protein L195_g032671 [Trifolium pratense]|uniref:Uncharacterized protein n=1 Tax=Trifolium pratense TaxID=57577 RepID=A0A2K3LDV1_TRIPR|nr:hypothetical protein L195_g032671 [Trifolium pratense]
MCNTSRDPNKGKEKVNGEPVVKTMEIHNKRKAIVQLNLMLKQRNQRVSTIVMLLAASSNFDAGNLLGELQHIPHIDEVINKADQDIVSPQIIVPEIDYGSVSKIDLTLRL